MYNTPMITEYIDGLEKAMELGFITKEEAKELLREFLKRV